MLAYWTRIVMDSCQTCDVQATSGGSILAPATSLVLEAAKALCAPSEGVCTGVHKLLLAVSMIHASSGMRG